MRNTVSGFELYASNPEHRSWLTGCARHHSRRYTLGKQAPEAASNRLYVSLQSRPQLIGCDILSIHTVIPVCPDGGAQRQNVCTFWKSRQTARSRFASTWKEGSAVAPQTPRITTTHASDSSGSTVPYEPNSAMDTRVCYGDHDCCGATTLLQVRTHYYC